MSAPTDQRAGLRPISFVLQKGNSFGSPVTLKIRPTDLTKNEPSRTSVRQTLGHGVIGWADRFGQGLPSVTIAGHTGWRTAQGSGKDGVQAFHELNKLLTVDYHAAVQQAIDGGQNPGQVKLLFVDMLDEFSWCVEPMVFTLQRSKTQPLLMKYNIVLQAIDTAVDNPLMDLRFDGNLLGGISALSGPIGFLKGIAGKLGEWVGKALAFKDQLLAPIASTIKDFTTFTTQVFETTQSMVGSVRSLVDGTANSLISIAKDLATAGTNVYRTIASIKNLPQQLKASIVQVGAAFNEVACIFRNALKPKKAYQDYTGLYGASNCSSTSGGRQPSAYVNSSVFAQIQTPKGPLSISSQAMSSIQSVNRGDPVLSPLPIYEIGRNLSNITSGMTITGSAA